MKEAIAIIVFERGDPWRVPCRWPEPLGSDEDIGRHSFALISAICSIKISPTVADCVSVGRAIRQEWEKP